MAARSPKKRRQIGKAVRFKEELDSESDDKLPSTPPPKTKKKKRKGNYCSKTFKVGKPWQSGMVRDNLWDRKSNKAFKWVKKQYCEANPT